jgi:hypothetical protein
MEEREWKPFRNALDKSDRKKFDVMFDIPRLYTSACSYSVQTVRLYPILMSILLYHFKQLTQCISEAERIEAKLNSSKNKGSTKEKEEEQLAQPTAMPQQLQGQLRLSEFCNLNDVDQ